MALRYWKVFLGVLISQATKSCAVREASHFRALADSNHDMYYVGDAKDLARTSREAAKFLRNNSDGFDAVWDTLHQGYQERGEAVVEYLNTSVKILERADPEMKEEWKEALDQATHHIRNGTKPVYPDSAEFRSECADLLNQTADKCDGWVDMVGASLLAVSTACLLWRLYKLKQTVDSSRQIQAGDIRLEQCRLELDLQSRALHRIWTDTLQRSEDQWVEFQEHFNRYDREHLQDEENKEHVQFEHQLTVEKALQESLRLPIPEGVDRFQVAERLERIDRKLKTVQTDLISFHQTLDSRMAEEVQLRNSHRDNFLWSVGRAILQVVPGIISKNYSVLGAAAVEAAGAGVSAVGYHWSAENISKLQRQLDQCISMEEEVSSLISVVMKLSQVI